MRLSIDENIGGGLFIFVDGKKLVRCGDDVSGWSALGNLTMQR